MKGWIHFGLVLLGLCMLLGCSPKPVAEPYGADLVLTTSADRSSVWVGENITFTVTLTNLGPLHASGIVFGDHLPRELALVSCSCHTGSVTDASFCEVVRLESGQSTAATIVATPVDGLAPAESELSLTTKALVAEFLAFDPDRENNTASLSVQVLVTPSADQAP